MNTSLKYMLAAVFSTTFYVASAQDLSRKIPQDAMAVVTIKGANFTDLMSVQDLDTTFVGRELIEKLSRESNGSFRSLNDIGFDLSANFYYYNQSNDSVTYNCFLAPVRDVVKLDQLIGQTGKKFSINGKMRTSYDNDSTNVVYWNENYLLFVSAEGKSSYFALPEVSSRLGLKSYPSLPGTVATEDTVAVTIDDYKVDAPVEVVMAPPPPPVLEQVRPAEKKSSGKTAGKSKLKSSKKVAPKKKTPPIVEVPVVVPVEDDTVNEEYVYTDTTYAAEQSYGAYDNAYFENEKLKKAIVGRWTVGMMNRTFGKDDLPSVMDNKDFVKNVDNSAIMSVWIPGISQLAESFIPTTFFKGMNIFGGYGSLTANVILENKSIRLNSGLMVSNEMVAAAKKIYKRKLNKKFLNYVNEDQMIGYMGYAVDTKAYLQEYPKLISRVYGTLFKDEIEMASDLVSLLLDEKAIAKVVKGDGLFVFNGLNSKDVSYKAYEYNEDNFETTEVMKTKQETVPDFLFMYSSDDTQLLEKLIAYGVKKEFVRNQNTYYELTIPKSPLALYFTIKGGIVFIGTDQPQMEQISTGTYRARLNAANKKMLLANNFSGYFSPNKLVAKVPSDMFGGGRSGDKVLKTLNSLGDIRIKSNKINGNLMSGEMSMEIPEGQPNALRYLFDVFAKGLK